jgi:tetraacyldisaccharide 4'-kinase
MKKYLRLLLLPFSAVYGCVVFVRNRLFDWKFLRSELGELPTIIVGNLSAGGSGKTPFTQYLIALLGENFGLGVLSRGYGRKSQGFLWVTPNAQASECGDEPLQISKRFPRLRVAVCEDRLAGIDRMSREATEIELVILDDAFQHRKLKGDFNIVLTDYNHPYWDDMLLPAGGLRDMPFETRRAQMIVVTKCPETLDELEMSQIRRTIWPEPHQSLYFASLKYGGLIQFSGTATDINEVDDFLAFSGIANPQLFEKECRKLFSPKKFKNYPDHYQFSGADIQNLCAECGTFGGQRPALLTTEKDAVRIMELSIPESIPMFFLPVEFRILKEEKKFVEEVLKIAGELRSE